MIPPESFEPNGADRTLSSPCVSSPRLSNTSYVVLGLVEACQPATPYELKRFAEISVFNFWSVPHTQVYGECARLASEGLLDEEREQAGRRRRIYRLTAAGGEALDRWRAESSFEPLEFRDPGLIKIFFGADPAAIAPDQLEGHERHLRFLEELHAEKPDMPAGMRLALEVGIAHEREFVRFWRRLADDRGARASARGRLRLPSGQAESRRRKNER
jgi:DNA-binding PadR family transcriptional regulator